MHDPTPRLLKIGDALSTLFNVMFGPNHTDTDANESISGRAHRTSTLWLESWIDRLFRILTLGEQDNHCENAYFRDKERAHKTLARHKSEYLPRRDRL